MADWSFGKLIVQIWPLLSLKKLQKNVKALTNLVLQIACEILEWSDFVP
jgi:hypothetical protein